MEFSDTPREHLRKRTFEEYAGYFGYENGSNLQGKRILDVGAGNSNFAEKAKEFGATVIRVDPKYGQDETRPNDTENAFAGAVQSLPIQDDSVDECVASKSLYWVPETDWLQSLKELWRVTRDGGYIKVIPANLKRLPPNKEFILPFNAQLVEVEDPDTVSHTNTTLVIKKEGKMQNDVVTQKFEELVNRMSFTSVLDQSFFRKESPSIVHGWKAFYASPKNLIKHNPKVLTE